MVACEPTVKSPSTNWQPVEQSRIETPTSRRRTTERKTQNLPPMPIWPRPTTGHTDARFEV